MRIVLSEADAGERLDKLIVKAVPGLGRAAARRLFEQGKVRVFEVGHDRGRRAAKGDVAPAGGAIDVDLEAGVATGAAADGELPLTIALETDQVVVVDKPAGQASAPISPGERGTIANALVARFPEMAGIGFSPREPGLCHRLDTGTSGLLVAAKTRAAFDELTRALKEGRLDKRYLLICASEGLPETGTIEFPLAPHPKDRRRVLACVHPRDVARNAPRPASTSFRIVRVAGAWALVEASAPKASRHQIRAHFAALGHPLLGDALYGGAPLDIPRAGHALHAHHVTWKGSAVVPAFTIESPLPAELEAILG